VTTDAPIIEELAEEPCIDATGLVEEEIEIELDDEPYQEVIILDLRACADPSWLG
jgi:hypothetical protein